MSGNTNVNGIKFLKNMRNLTTQDLHNGPSRETLPQAIQKMSREETICNFCGVSYLVFSEIKELEKTISKLQKEYESTKANNDVKERLINVERERDQLLYQQENANKHLSSSNEIWEIKFNNEVGLLKKLNEDRIEAMNNKFNGEISSFKSRIDAYQSALSMTRKALLSEKRNLGLISKEAKTFIGDTSKLLISVKNETKIINVRLKREISKNKEIIELNEKNEVTISMQDDRISQLLSIQKQLMIDNENLLKPYEKEVEKNKQLVIENEKNRKNLLIEKGKVKELDSIISEKKMIEQNYLNTQETLKKKIIDIEKELKDFKQFNIKLQENYDIAEKEIQCLREQAFKQNNDIHQAKSKLNEKECLIKTQLITIENLKTNVSDQNKNKRKEMEEKENLTKTMEECQAEIKTLKRINADLTKSLEEIETGAALNEEQRKHFEKVLSENNARYEDEIKDHAIQNIELQRSLSELQSSHSELERKYSILKSSQEAQLSSNAQKEQVLEKEISLLKTSKYSLETRIQEIQLDDHIKNTEMLGLKNELRSYREERTSNKKELEALNSKIMQMEKEIIFNKSDINIKNSNDEEIEELENHVKRLSESMKLSREESSREISRLECIVHKECKERMQLKDYIEILESKLKK